MSVVRDGSEPPDRPFFSGSVDADYAGRILELVEQRAQSRRSSDIASPLAVPLPNALDALAAPLFDASRGRWLARLVKRVLNLPLRLLGRPQQYFNLAVRDLLASSCDVLRAAGEAQAVLRDEVVAQGESIRWLRDRERELAGALEELRERMRRAEETLGPVWPSEPAQIAPGLYARLQQAMPDGLRVCVGCGEFPLSEYVNVDTRPLPGVLAVQSLAALPFPAESVAELFASHAIERFRQRDLASRVLPAWHVLLRPGGRLRIIAADWNAALAMYRAGELDERDLRRVAFGAQAAEGEDRLAAYTPPALLDLLRAAGFVRCTVLREGRSERGEPEMEVVALRER